MDVDLRAITKIAREAKRFVTRQLKATGLGAEDYEYLHFVRHHGGCTQADVAETLNLDKSTISRKTARLIAQGFIQRRDDQNDHRSFHLYATDKAEETKKASVGAEERFYRYIQQQSNLTPEETETFLSLLSRLYDASKAERKTDFSHLLSRD
jgi:DNA-binding MarR family transcriptional regulator